MFLLLTILALMVTEEARTRRLAVLDEMNRVQDEWFRRQPDTLAGLISFVGDLEARTQELRRWKRIENRVFIALNSTLSDLTERLEAWQWVLEAYFLMFPDQLPKPAGPRIISAGGACDGA